MSRRLAGLDLDGARLLVRVAQADRAGTRDEIEAGLRIDAPVRTIRGDRNRADGQTLSGQDAETLARPDVERRRRAVTRFDREVEVADDRRAVGRHAAVERSLRARRSERQNGDPEAQNSGSPSLATAD